MGKGISKPVGAHEPQPVPLSALIHTANCRRSARFSSASSRCVRTVARSAPMRIPSHLTMTGQ